MTGQPGRSLRGYGPPFQLSVGIVLAGLLALAITVVLSSLFLHSYLVDQQKTSLARQVQALADCSTRVNVARAAAKRKGVNRIIEEALAGTPERGAIVIDSLGALQYASVFPAPLLHTLVARLRHDFNAASHPRGASTTRSFTLNGNIVTDIAISCLGSGRGSTAQSAGLLIAEGQTVADNQWHDVVVFLVISALAGLVLMVLAGLVLGQAILRPMRTMAAAARAIAAGDHDRRVTPEGANETRDLAAAFNTMVNEVARRRQLDHDLLANLSHELGAPLGLIQGYAEGLADGVIEGDQQRLAALRAITAESERLRRVTGDLLDLALLETGEVRLQVEDVPVDELLANLTLRFDPVARQQGIVLSVDVPPVLSTVQTDGLRLEQVLVNLLNNALRHTPQGGSITLSARPASGGVNLAIADTGAGIPAEELSRIWERFYQVDKARDRRGGDTGLGLGLAISRSTITLLGGRIDVESVVAEGTTFRIWLPLKRSSA